MTLAPEKPIDYWPTDAAQTVEAPHLKSVSTASTSPEPVRLSGIGSEGRPDNPPAPFWAEAQPAPSTCHIPHDLLPGRRVAMPGTSALVTHFACGDCDWTFTSISADPPSKDAHV